MRALGGLALLAALALAWLSLGDRASPLALDVVELEGRLGAPLWAMMGVFGVALVALGGRSKPKVPPRRLARVRPPPAALPLGEGWEQELAERAAALQLGPGVSLRVEPRRSEDIAPVPFVLELQRRTPEQARRAVEAFAGFLAGAPTPPRARIRYVDCPAPSTPRAKQVAGSLRACFPADAVQVVGTEDRVELIFANPDPRWTQQP